MQYYIDFDSTLYNTSGLIEKMLKVLAKEINKQNSTLDIEDIYLEEKSLFNSKNIYNIFELCKYLASKYNLNTEKLIGEVKCVIDNGEEFVYDDSVAFLKSIKAQGYILNLLTYSSQDSLDYQMQKILGSGLTQYLDNLIITSTPKWQLHLDYSLGFFVDDNPNDIAGIYSKNPLKVVRIKRANNKYSNIPMPENIDIQEYKSLEELLRS